MRRLAASFGIALLLAACGQRGDLYIPQPRGEAVPATPAASPVSEAEAEERARREAARSPAGN